jgi:hypothetical protein
MDVRSHLAPLPTPLELRAFFGPEAQLHLIETSLGVAEFTFASVVVEEQLLLGVNAVTRQGQVRWSFSPRKLVDLKLEGIRSVSIEQVPESASALIIRSESAGVRRLLLSVEPEILLAWGSVQSARSASGET